MISVSTSALPGPRLSGNWAKLSAGALRSLADKIAPPPAPVAVEIDEEHLALLDDIAAAEPLKGVALNFTRSAVVYDGPAPTVIGLTRIKKLQDACLIGPDGDYRLTDFARTVLAVYEAGVYRLPQDEGLSDQIISEAGK